MTRPAPQSSFVNLFPEILYDRDQVGELTLDIWNNYRVTIFPKTLESKAFFRYRVSESDTLENIASRFYGNTRLWWLTLVINDVEDPFDFIENNMIDRITTGNGIIKILKQEYVDQIQSRVKSIKEVLTRKNEIARFNNEDVKQV